MRDRRNATASSSGRDRERDSGPPPSRQQQQPQRLPSRRHHSPPPGRRALSPPPRRALSPPPHRRPTSSPMPRRPNRDQQLPSPRQREQQHQSGRGYSTDAPGRRDDRSDGKDRLRERSRDRSPAPRHVDRSPRSTRDSRSTREQQRESSRERQRQQQPQQQAARAAAAGDAGGAFDMLERFLGKHEQLKEVVSPSMANVNTVLLRKVDLLNFAAVQHWLATHMSLHLQLLAGTFIICAADDIPLPGDAREDKRSAVPLRCRQVAAVEVPADMPVQAVVQQDEDVVVLLEGGGEVRANRLSDAAMQDIQGNEELCCELSALQLDEVMPLLRLYDLTHTVWRLKLCADLEAMIQDFDKEQDELQMKGMDAEVQEMAASNFYSLMRTRMQQLPKATFVDEVLGYIELLPGGPAVLQSQLRAEAARWRDYLQHMLSLPPEQRQQQQLLVQEQPPPFAAAGMDIGLQQQQYDDYPPAFEQQQQQQAYDDGIISGFGWETEEQGMFDDPTGFGDHPAASAAAVPGRSGAVNTTQQPQHSLGFGMAANPTGAAATGSGLRLHASLQQQRQRQQQQQQQTRPGLGGLRTYSSSASTAAAALHQNADVQVLMGKYNSGAVGRQGSGIAATTAAAGAQQEAPAADYSYWVEQGDITAAESNPRLRRAPAPFQTAAIGRDSVRQDTINSTSTYNQGLNAAVRSGLLVSSVPPGLAPVSSSTPDLQAQQQQQRNGSSRDARVSVLDRLGPAAATQQQQQHSERDRDRRPDRHHNSIMRGDQHDDSSGKRLSGAAVVSPRGQYNSIHRTADASPARHSSRGGDRGRRESPGRQQQQPLSPSARDRGRDRNPESSSRDRRDKAPVKNSSRREGSPGKYRSDDAHKAFSSRDRSRSRDRHKERQKGKSSRSSAKDNKDSRADRGRSPVRKEDSKPASSSERKKKSDTAAGSRRADKEQRDGSSQRDSKADTATAREPSPGLAEILKRVLPPAASAPPPAAAVRHRSSSRGRSSKPGSLRQDREQRPRSRSRSPFREDDRSSKRTRLLNGHADGAAAVDGRPSSSHGTAAAVSGGRDSAAAAGRPSPVPLEAARRRFEGRLEGADKLFGDLSAEAATRQWLHRLADLAAEGKAPFEGGRYFKLHFIKDRLPIPYEVFSPWGSVYQFLSGHPALSYIPTQKLVGLKDGVKIDLLPMLPPAAPQQQQQQRGAGFRDGDGPGLRDRGREPYGDRGGRLSDAATGARVPAVRSPVPEIVSPEEQARRDFQDALSGYAHMLRQTLSEAPNRGIDLDEAYGLLPPQLREKVQPRGPVDLPKVLTDHIGGVDVIHSQGRSMVRAILPGGHEPWAPRPCMYWDVQSWGGCKKATVCDFKHDLVPGGFRTGPSGWL